MHFWSQNFGPIRILVLKLISFLFLKNHFYFNPCHQPSNKTLLRGKQNALVTDMMLTWHSHDIQILLKKLFSIFQCHISILIFYFHNIIIIIIVIIIITFIIFFRKNITTCSSCSSQIQEINPTTNPISGKPKSKSSNQI